MTSVTKFIADNRALADAATPGPWRYDGCDLVAFIEGEGEECFLMEATTGFASQQDYELTAHARTALPKALEMLEVAMDTLEHYADHNYTSFDTSCDLAKSALSSINKLAGGE